jgi:hypothetical protein
MVAAQKKYENLSTREGFNDSLLHFRAVSSILGDFEGKTNLADLVRELIDDKKITIPQIDAIVHALLVDKYGYFFRSVNFEKSLTDFSTISAETKKWKAVDVVIAYCHPELGLTLINPKNEDHFEAVTQLKKDELAVVYAGAFDKELDKKTADTALDTMLALLNGTSKKTPAALLKGSFSYKKKEKKAAVPEKAKKSTRSKSAAKAAPKAAAAGTGAKTPEKAAKPAAAPEQAASSGPKRMTPMYSVPVTNELFHNGNVEAWKRIIQSYTAKHPDCEVLVFYDGERIHDINTLFKWGKVKHGSAILFAVVGAEIKDVAKLQRYLQQGASHRFEDFLKFPVNQIIDLF